MARRTERIAFVIPSLSDGGSNRFVMKIAAGMARLGYSVDLIAIDPTGHYASEIEANLRRIDLGIVPIKGMTVLRAIWSIRNYIRREKPKVVMSATTAVNILLIIATLLTRQGTTIIVSERNAIKASAADASLMSRFYRILIPVVYPRASSVVAVSKGLEDELVKAYGIDSDLVCTIYNPVVSPDIDELQGGSVDDPWLEDSSIPVILSAGRLHPQKDFSTLIKGFALFRSHSEARLIILGEGRCRQELQGLIRKLGIQDFVRMPGFVDNPYAYMSRANVFAMTSLYEGICNVVIEALACGCPVIATDCPGGGPREVLGNGRWGTLIPTGSPQHLSDALATVLHSPRRTEFYKRRAGFFSVENSLQGYEKLFSTQQ